MQSASVSAYKRDMSVEGGIVLHRTVAYIISVHRYSRLNVAQRAGQAQTLDIAKLTEPAAMPRSTKHC